METQQEKKNKRIAMFTSIGIHAALVLLFLFLVAWRAPNPPLPEYGIELNFGMDTQGSGAVQPKTPVGSQRTQEEEPEQPEPVAEEQPQEESVPEEVKAVVEQEQVVSKIESPVKVEEKKEEVKKPEKPKEKEPEPKKEEVVKPKVDESSVYKPKTQPTESTNKTNEGKEGEPANHGDDEKKTGDKGSPQGTLDANAMYGKAGGGGGGSSLELAGWNWDEIPRPNVPNNVTGRIVFEIIVNADGELERYNIIENSLSPEAAKACREAVEKLTFTKTGTNVPALSKGRITFVVRSR